MTKRAVCSAFPNESESRGRQMMRNKPKELRLETIIGDTMIQQLDEYDRQVREFYLAVGEPGLRIFDELMGLHSLLMISIAMDVPECVPKFVKPSPVQMVLAASACGSFRNLRVARKLLVEGYFPEMHATLRMVEQWLECAIIVEGNPAAASLLMEHGLNGRNREVKKAIEAARNSSEELQNLYRNMRNTFNKLSQRCHPLRTAFDLIRKKEAKQQLFVSGIVSEEMFKSDTFALVNMAINSLNTLSRHFLTLPLDWQTRFKQAKETLIERTGNSNIGAKADKAGAL
jgi:hypothetical protein